MSGSGSTTGRVLREPRHVIAVLRVLVLAGLSMLGLGTPPAHRFLYWMLVVVYGLTIFGYLWARNRDFQLPRIKWLVFLFDIGLVSALIVLRGDGAREFLMAYFALVLMAAMAEGLGNAITNAILVSTAYALLTNWGTPISDLLAFGTISHFVFFFIIAVFMGHLAHEARNHADDRARTQEALRTTSSELRTSTEALKAARDALRANDRLATLGMLSAGIAHELRSPLAAIVNNLEPGTEILEELEARLNGDSESRELAAELRSIMQDCEIASNQLVRVARDLTWSARQGPVESVPVCPRESIDSVLRLLRRRLGEDVAVDTSITTTRCMRADPGHVLQVLTNLITNALDAMDTLPAGSTRCLVVRAEDTGAREMALVVEDSGPGVPDPVKEQILEPFFTTKRPGKGTGLGLHLVSEIVKAHRGSIRFEARPGGGTRFVVTLPALSAPGPTENNHVAEEEDPARRGRRGDHPSGAASDAAPRAVRTAARV